MHQWLGLHSLLQTRFSTICCLSFGDLCSWSRVWSPSSVSKSEATLPRDKRAADVHVNRYTEIPKEAAEVVEPRPPASWPHEGALSVEKLVIRYAVSLLLFYTRAVKS